MSPSETHLHTSSYCINIWWIQWIFLHQLMGSFHVRWVAEFSKHPFMTRRSDRWKRVGQDPLCVGDSHHFVFWERLCNLQRYCRNRQLEIRWQWWLWAEWRNKVQRKNSGQGALGKSTQHLGLNQLVLKQVREKTSYSMTWWCSPGGISDWIGLCLILKHHVQNDITSWKFLQNLQIQWLF